MKNAEVIQVIRTRLLRRGRGRTEADEPVRIIEQYWSLDGQLLAENDPWPGPRLVACPCGEPSPIGAKPCSFEQPCSYGQGKPKERWS